VIVFRIYPEQGRTLYVRVLVHDTLKAMRERSRELKRRGYSADYVGRNCYGFCNEWNHWQVQAEEDGGRCRRDPCIAEVNLARKHCTMGIVTHELLHATFAWARRVRFPFACLSHEAQAMEGEEWISYAHGDLCRDFMVRAEAAGLYQ
jgi:hypothetical protein